MSKIKSHRFGVAGRLSASLIGLALLTTLAAGVALWGMGRFKSGFDLIIEEKMTRLNVVARLVQHTESIAVVAPRVALAQSSPQLRQLERSMNDQLNVLTEAFRTMNAAGVGEQEIRALKIHMVAMTENLDKVSALVRRRVDLSKLEKATVRKLSKLMKTLAPLRLKMRDLGKVGVEIDDEIRAVNTSLLMALSIDSTGRVRSLKKKVHKSFERIKALVPTLRNTSVQADLNEFVDLLVPLALESRGIMTLRGSQADVNKLLSGKLRRNTFLMIRLVSTASTIYVTIEQEIARDRAAFNTEYDQGYVLLSIIAIVAVFGAALVFIYLRVRVINRLTGLEKCMQKHAQGEAVEIPMSGQDEITNMAESFSFFVTEIANREDALGDARDEAHRANRAKGEFLANMSHEIRTPMNAVIGLSSLVLQTDMTSRQRDYQLKIQSSAQALLGIINDILDFSKIEAGKLDMESIEFSLSDVLSDVSNLVSQRSDDKGLEMVFAVSGNFPEKLKGDPLRLAQILTNLCTNAVKFTDVGEIVVRCDFIETVEGRSKLQFSVRDTGVGLTAKQQGRLFKAFAQADSSTTREFGGTGLGLTISQRLVEMMNGKIWVKSEKGVGSTFFFTADFETPVQNDPKMRWQELKGARVLVADDNSTTRMLLAEMLSNLSCEVTKVDDGDAAVAEIERAGKAGEPPYKVVLMDWEMPRMNGLDASTHLKAGDGSYEVPIVIMVTGHGREKVMTDDASFNAIDALLVKPINPSLLFDTMLTLATGGVVDIQDADIVDLAGMKAGKGGKILQGRKVLLVEDNAINQQVASEILAHWDIGVDLANNGNEALITLDEVGEDYYDAVLMDIQMPGMDGKEATRQLRGRMDMSDLIVIAMTAHAMEEERQNCFKAGMNDHVAKPIDPADLFKKLVTHLTDRPRARGARDIVIDHKTDKVIEAPKSSSALPDSVPGLDIASGLKRVMGNAALYRKLLIDFAESLPSGRDQLKQAIHATDWEEARKEAHGLKGVAGNIGAMPLFNVTQSIEKDIKMGADAAVQGRTDDLDAVVDELLGSLAILETNAAQESPAKPLPSAQPTPDIDPKQINILLDGLEKMLMQNDMGAMQMVSDNKEILASLIGDSAAELESCIGSLDFEGARNILKNAPPSA